MWFQYDVPYDSKRFSIYTATWQMFVIYNERNEKTDAQFKTFFLFNDLYHHVVMRHCI